MRTIAALVLGITCCAGTAVADSETTKMVRVKSAFGAQTVLIEKGPLPGIVILNTNMLYADGESSMGHCSTLVNEAVLQRDLAKLPLQQGEILGFSCTTKVIGQ